MRCIFTVAIGMMLSVFAAGAWAQTPSPDAWGNLVASNDLDLRGKSPFHLGMTFQLYDLSGKPTVTGSFETWWTDLGSRRNVVHLAGLDEKGSAPEGADVRLMRSSYLVEQLMQSAIHPVEKKQLPEELVARTVLFGKVRLDCLGPTPTSTDAMNARLETACSEPSGTDVRFLQGLGGKETLVRNKTGKFHETYVALELRIGYLGKDAIAGKVMMLQADASAKLGGEDPAATSDPKEVRLPGGVIAGHRIQFTEPSYPERAKLEHLRGSVVLNAVIGVDGIVRRLVPIASTDPMFTDVATQAVKKWKYSPYLLNGMPTEVDTTITVNFELTGG